MLALSILLSTLAGTVAGDDFAVDAATAIEELAGRELFGHYDIERVEVLEVRDRDGEIGGPYPGYGFRTVRAAVRAIRNERWSENLNPEIRSWRECETSALLFLLCRPAGYEFRGELELEMVATTEGWKIVDRNHRSLRRYPLARYLICQADRAGATELEIIRGCFAAAPS